MSCACRPLMYMIELFNLPIDFCGIDFGKDLNSEACLKLNPIHSIPFMVVNDNGENASFNGGEAILSFLLLKYRDMIPSSFYPSDPLSQAKLWEKYHFVHSVLERATLYQYVLPLMGMMSECQYDLCKRDFALNMVEGWCSKGKFVCGDTLSFVDLDLLSVHQTNMFNQHESFDVPWKWAEKLPNYPSMHRLLTETLPKMDAILKINTTSLGDGAPATILFQEQVAHNVLPHKLPGRGRMFQYDASDGMIHPNAVPYLPTEMKNIFDKPVA